MKYHARRDAPVAGHPSTFMKSALFLTVCIFAGIAISSHGADSGHSVPLRAIATTEETDVHPDAVFDVTVRLQNLTDSVQIVKIPDPDWDRVWKSSNRRVTWDAWESDESTEITIQIAPHQTYTFSKPIKMFVDESVKPGRIEFRMGFRTGAFGKTLWSAPIILDVTE